MTAHQPPVNHRQQEGRRAYSIGRSTLTAAATDGTPGNPQRARRRALLGPGTMTLPPLAVRDKSGQARAIVGGSPDPGTGAQGPAWRRWRPAPEPVRGVTGWWQVAGITSTDHKLNYII